ncbi:beta-ketoacyl synthase chain length factor [Rhizobacter sp. Root404]|uniref:beta-ketoacyl synthase chain length factor n=1 Tax=Rhizobacter sp. Root404 TaxID=1736528 RepID=UPI0006FE1F06|nr:beta-ketoacyl synthase chain length factor [Rhizobacter sp. Root404]KQW35920.1 3-oxoacyl-ACP synthase [Rhizobacter sp. Root404]
MSGLRVWVDGIGLAGPGLASWAASLDVLRGTQAHATAATVLPPPARLPPAERRRAGAAVKLALAIADEAVAQAQLDPATLATVFTSSSGEGTNCHALCETLATPTPMVSPTRFTNSVHNAASGCWHIAVGSRAASTSLCAFDGSFGAGLIEAATSVVLGRAPQLLVASDSPYPEPLHATRPLPDHFGLALVLAPAPGPRSIAALTITLIGADEAVTRCADPALDELRRVIPAAAALPLLLALAREGRPSRVVLGYLAGSHLQIDLA